jgi:hypothetical protein
MFVDVRLFWIECVGAVRKGAVVRPDQQVQPG